jgi:hypothetical protein
MTDADFSAEREMFPAPGSIAETLGLPHVRPRDSMSESDEPQLRVRQCIAAGIQY